MPPTFNPFSTNSNDTWDIVINDNDGPSYSERITNFTLRTEETVQEIQDNLLWKVTNGGQISDFDFGSRLIKMIYDNIESWFVKTATEEFSTEKLGRVYSGEEYDHTNGVDAIIYAVLENASENIGNDIANGERPVGAFNRETSGWPHRCRALLAAYESEYGSNTQDNSSYETDVSEFAMSEGFNDYEPQQVSLSVYDGGNPFEVESLSEEEAKAVVVMQSFVGSDAPIEEYVDEIEDVDSFLEWLYKVGSVETAIHANEYDSVVPIDVMEVLAPPTEWDELDPTDIQTEECIECNDTYYNVIKDTDAGPERCWVDDSGVQKRIYNVGIEEDIISTREYTTEGVVCSRCYATFDDESQPATVVFPNHKITIRVGYGLAEVDNDACTAEFSDLTDEQMDFLTNSASRRPNDYIEIESGEGPSAAIEQDNAVRTVMFDAETTIDVEEPVMILQYSSFGDTERILYIPRFCSETAMAAKGVLENAEEYAEV